MMMTELPSHEHDLMRATFSDEEPAFTASTTSTDNEADVSAAQSVASEETAGRHALFSYSSTDDEYDPLDPIQFKEPTDEELKAYVDKKLDRQGIQDPFARSMKRRSMLKNKKLQVHYMKEDLYSSGYSEWKEKQHKEYGAGGFPGK